MSNTNDNIPIISNTGSNNSDNQNNKTKSNRDTFGNTISSTNTPIT